MYGIKLIFEVGVSTWLDSVEEFNAILVDQQAIRQNTQGQLHLRTILLTLTKSQAEKWFDK
jgi:hypothetical protein